MFKCIHGLASYYPSVDVTKHVDIHGYDTRSAENMDLYITRCTKEIYERSFLHKGSSLWNKLPPWVKESTSLYDFKHNFRLLIDSIHPEFIVLFLCTPILGPIVMLLFYQFCLQLVRYIHIRNLSQSYHDIVVFTYDLYPHTPTQVFKFFNTFAPPLTSNPGSALEKRPHSMCLKPFVKICIFVVIQIFWSLRKYREQ